MGGEVTYLEVEEDGLIDLKELEAAITTNDYSDSDHVC